LWDGVVNYYLMGAEFQLCKMKRVLEIGGDGCKQEIYLVPQNSMFRIVKM
jgi:hypothetical protein